MASSDAGPRPISGADYRITVPIWDADGDLVAGPTSLDSEISKDGGTFTDCTNEAVEIATSSGICYLDLTSTEMTADTVAVKVTCTNTGAKPTVIVMYPDVAMSPVNVAQWNGTNVASPATAGIPDVNVKNIDNDAASASGTVTFPNATLASTTNITAAAGCAVSSLGANVITAAATAADFTTEIQAGLATPTNITAGTITTVTNVTTVNGLAANVITAASMAADASAEIADAVLDEDMTGHQTQGSLGQAIGDPVADTNTIYKAVVTDAAGATVGIDVVAVKADTAAILVDTGTTLDAALAVVDANVDAILVDTGTTLDGRIPAALVSGRMDSSVGAMAANVLTAAATAADFTTEIQAGLATAAALDAVDNFLDTELPALTEKMRGVVLSNGVIGNTFNNTTTVVLPLTTYSNDEINDHLLVIYDVSTSEYHARWIADWVNTTDTATVATLPFTPEDDVDLYWLLPIRRDVTGGSGLDEAGVRAAIGLASANLDTQLSTIDTVVDAILVDTAEIGAAGAGLTVLGTAAELAKVPKSDGTTTWNATALAAIETQANDALVANHLDHLLAADYDPASQPGVATALLNELIGSDAGVSRFTANSLELAPTGGSAPTVGEIADAVLDEAMAGHTTAGTLGKAVADILVDTGTTLDGRIPAALVSGRMDSYVGEMADDVITVDTFATGAVLTGAQVQSEVNDALEAIHLDHLLAADYDPASQPGVATALLNEIIGSDAGVSRFTANALELAPTGGSAPTVGEIADAVWDEDATAHQTTGTFGQAIGDPVADTNSIYKAVVTDAAGATVGVDVVAVKADTAAILVDTGTTLDGRIPAALVSGRMDSSVGAMASSVLTALAVADDAGTEIAGKVWGIALPGAYGAGTAGNLIGNNVDATISSRATPAQVNTEVDTAIADARLDELLAADSDIDGAAPPTVGSVFHELMSKTAGSFTFDQTTDSNEAIRDNLPAAAPTAAAIADQVWDETLAGHLGAGSTGNALNAAGSAGDPWATAIPGAYGAGTAGKILGDNVNATISSRATQTSVDDLPTNTELATALGAADDAVLAQVALVKAKTDNLPADPADASDIAASFVTVNGKLDAIDAVTDKLDTALELDGAVYRYTTNALEQAPTGGSAPTAAEIADAVLDEDMTAHQTQGSLGQVIGDSVADADSIWGLVNTNLNATVGSRASQTSVDDLPTNGELATSLAGADDAVLAQVALVKAVTDALPNAGALTTIQSDLDDIQSKIGTPAGASVSADIAAIDADVADVPTTAEIATAVGARVVENGKSWDEITRLIFSVAKGKATGLTGATVTFRDDADTKDRIVATLVAGNRTPTTVDGT